MIIIIDAFNVIKCGIGGETIGVSEMHRFILRIDSYITLKKHEAIVVFDGGDSAYPTRHWDHGVLVIHSGYDQQADDEIIRLISHYHPESLLVVSSDREIVKHAHFKGIITIDAGAFKKLMHESELERKKGSVGFKKKKGLAEKRPGYRSTPELDVLMHKAAERIHVKKIDIEDEMIDGSEKGSRKRSKIERKLDQVIKKL